MRYDRLELCLGLPGQLHVPWRDVGFRYSRWLAKQLDELVGVAKAVGARGEVDVRRIDAVTFALDPQHGIELPPEVGIRLSVRREPHHLSFASEHRKAEILRQRRVEVSQRV